MIRTGAASDLLEAQLAGMSDNLLSIAGVGVGIGAAIYLVRRGWYLITALAVGDVGDGSDRWYVDDGWSRERDPYHDGLQEREEADERRWR